MNCHGQFMVIQLVTLGLFHAIKQLIRPSIHCHTRSRFPRHFLPMTPEILKPNAFLGSVKEPPLLAWAAQGGDRHGHRRDGAEIFKDGVRSMRCDYSEGPSRTPFHVRFREYTRNGFIALAGQPMARETRPYRERCTRCSHEGGPWSR